jgi:hypothetical protein
MIPSAWVNKPGLWGALDGTTCHLWREEKSELADYQGKIVPYLLAA